MGTSCPFRNFTSSIKAKSYATKHIQNHASFSNKKSIQVHGLSGLTKKRTLNTAYSSDFYESEQELGQSSQSEVKRNHHCASTHLTAECCTKTPSWFLRKTGAAFLLHWSRRLFPQRETIILVHSPGNV